MQRGCIYNNDHSDHLYTWHRLRDDSYSYSEPAARPHNRDIVYVFRRYDTIERPDAGRHVEQLCSCGSHDRQNKIGQEAPRNPTCPGNENGDTDGYEKSDWQVEGTMPAVPSRRKHCDENQDPDEDESRTALHEWGRAVGEGPVNGLRSRP
jgi:hypothetical protein